MIEFFEQFAELLKQALAYLELDTGCEPHEIESVEVEISPIGQCILWFPSVGVRYFAWNWDHIIGKYADWQFNS